MISIDDINRLAKANKLKPYQQEKNYIQTATLSGIYTALVDELIFKGGTALFFFYGLDRFSEDLDFTRIKQYNYNQLKTTISDIFTILHVNHEIKPGKSPAGKTLKVKAEGPLYKGPLSESIVDIDISERNDILLKPDIKEVIPIYDDLRPFTVPVMKKEEILAEKVRALMTRKRARDLYDIAFLLKKQVDLKYDLINKKLSYYNKTFNQEECMLQASSIKDIWQSELHGLFVKLPSFDDSLNLVLDKIKH